MTPSKLPRTKYLVRSTTSDLLSSSSEPVYEDTDTSKPVLMHRIQSVSDFRSKPLPRSTSQPETSIVYYTSSNAIDAEVSRTEQNGYPSGYKTPRPVRPPPSPPKNKLVTPSTPTTTVNGSHDCLGINTELAVKSTDVNSGERTPSPLPPPRPKQPPATFIYRSSSEYERKLPEMELKPQEPSKGSTLSRSPSPRPIRPPQVLPVQSKMETLNLNGIYNGRIPGAVEPSKGSTLSRSPSPRPIRPPQVLPVQSKMETLNLNGIYDGAMATDVVPSRPVRPPRPRRAGHSPTHTLSPSGCETLPAMAQEPLTPEYSPVYEEKTVPRPPNSQRSTSTSSTLRYGFDKVLTNESVRESRAPERLQPPPPPSFNPPPPPSIKRASLPCHSAIYQPESLYTEVVDPLYLTILPEENSDEVFRPSHSLYNSGSKHYETHAPCFPPHQPTTNHTDEINNLLKWLKAVGYSNNMGPSLYGLSIQDETREFNQRAMCVKKALHLFNLLLIKRNDSLRGHISELTSISDGMDKAQKKTKAMGIAGGTTGAVGSVATVVGIALAPVTMGASLVATAVGAGMVVSAGGMGAHAAIANKKGVDRKRVEKIVQDYKASIVDVERCMAFIYSGMDELRRHDLSRLQRAGAQPEALRMAELSRSMFRNDVYNAIGKCTAPTGGMPSERMLQAFAKEMDLYFTEKDGQKIKKSSECKFSSRVRLLAQSLQEALDDLNHIWEMFSKTSAFV